MQPPKLGKTLFLVLVFLLLSSCRKSIPPKIEVCIGDGFGGADCIEHDGSKLYRSPSALKNYWLTNEVDEAAYTSWCYQTSKANVQGQMDALKETIRP